ncbi:MAG: UPF0158 family protein [Caulobacteraceae bacterium]
MPVKINDLVGEMQLQSDEYKQFLNKETYEIIGSSTEELSIAEDSEEDDDFFRYPDWQRKSLREARDIVVNWKKYIELPDKWEINEYSIMEGFCGSVGDDRISHALYSSIRGKGAFRRFKYVLERYGIEQKWYSYYEDALSGIAIDWCQDNDIDYME